ncbi:glycosyltransferase family 4 protein [Cesiribacter andamanensis]|uniref:PEP-CTERM/exosortase A-associated glycosyltransferase, family n=1 Tax=Cesiribacter andamanensis AMV16 TaxID=1279009 RepID=M7N1L0_9BACT|nr:glycosyltransferase family 4 protein [Cesiribacter andamanensis]EMR02573.1 PEP-CTERM/exosortase A-associated glycosyltransferase, family [Cesiribacter andamanensis AMV16]
MKVYYLSITSFSDVDMGVLHHLPAHWELVYGVVIQKRNANYTLEELSQYCHAHGITLDAYQMPYNLKDPRCLLIFLKLIARIRSYQPDVLYMVTFDNIYLSKCSLLLNPANTLVALHDVEFHSNTRFMRILQLSRAITMHHFRHFQVFSREQQTTFERLYPTKQVSLIPLPLKDFGTGSGAQTKDSGKIRFLFFGNILPYKGLDLFLQALHTVSEHKELPTFEAVIAGRADAWESEYEPLIHKKELVQKHIRFIGNEEVAGLFLSAHYVVLPYRDATQSGPLKIAFQYNIPVIASDIASFREEITDGRDGYLFKAGDLQDLTNTLMQVLTNHRRDYERLRQAQADYVAATYSAERLRESFVTLFNTIA